MMELNKENEEQQMRKTGIVEIDGSVTRTPFAKVNRRSAFGEEPAGFDTTKSKQCLTTPSGKDCSLQRKAIGSLLSPPQGLSKKAPLTEGKATPSSSLPASVLELPSLSADIAPAVSLSCPQVLSSPHKLSLPLICETPPCAQDTSYQLSVTPATPSPLDLSLECEDASQNSPDQLACQVDSESGYELEVSSISCQEHSMDMKDTTNQQEATPDSKAAGPLSDVLSDEGISSGAVSPEKGVSSGLCSKNDDKGASHPDVAKSKDAVTGTLEAVEMQNPQGVSQKIMQASGKQLECSAQLTEEQAQNLVHCDSAKKSSQQSGSAAEPHAYMSEYAKFVETYTHEDSKCPDASSSLTDVTPFSQSWELHPDQASGCCPSDNSQHVVVMDSLSSFISDSDDSLCSLSTVQCQLTFPDGGSPGSGDMDESVGFVRSSESKFDLRENPLGHSDGRASPEIDCLNLSISDQRVEFFALPSSASLLKHAPNLGEVRSRSVGSSPILLHALEQALRPAEDRCASIRETQDAAEASAMTTNTVAVTAPPSHALTLTYESRTFTQAEALSGSRIAPAESTSVALSPIPRCGQDIGVNTNTTETSEADMMAVVVTSDVALSPVVCAEQRQQEDKCHRLEQVTTQQQNRIASLEAELSTLRAASEAAAQKQSEVLATLQEKSKKLEKCYQDEVQKQKIVESESYRHQFELAQQMVQEKEAELSEIRGLFSDLQAAAEKQEKVSKAYKEVHSKILSLAEENCSLRKTLAEKAASKEDKEHSQTEVKQLQQDKANLEEETHSLRQTMAINNTNLAKLEKLYSVSSSDLLVATGSVVKMNAELAGARKALQDALLSKEALARHASELEERLSATIEDSASVSAALKHSQIQLQKQSSVYEKLRVLSQKMKTIYDDKIENMSLGVENLQMTLDNRERDIDNLEKDLYECRNIILEQRYKIDGLQSELQEARNHAASDQAEKEDIEFYKESNAFLEAERSVYVLSLRDLEEKLKAVSLQSSQHQQAAEDAEKLAQDLQEEKHRLKSELSAVRSQFLASSQALTVAHEQHEQSETVAMAAANDLLQHMRLMLAGLKKKIGLQDVPELYSQAQPTQQQQQPPPQPPASAQSKSVKSKRHSRKSFVSTILAAVNTSTTPSGSNQGEGLIPTVMEDDEDFREVETGSYLDENFNHSAAKGSEEVNIASSAKLPKDLSLSKQDSKCSTNSIWAESQAPGSQGDRKQPPQCLSAGAALLGESHSTAFSPVRVTSTVFPPPPSLLNPPSSQPPPSSAFARIRPIPKTKRRSEQPSSSHHHSPLQRVVESLDGRDGGESRLLDCMATLKEVFSNVVRLASIMDRATQLSLQDLREENGMLRERTEIMEKRLDRNSAELSISYQKTVDKDNTIAQLQHQLRERTEHMMNLTNHKFDVKRLMGELKRLEGQLENERSEKEVVSTELENLLQRLEHSANSSGDGGTAQARCMRDIISLKKKNEQLSNRLEEQRDHYEELGAKAARRMRILDSNWKKAEEEVYKLDQLVDNIKQVADVQPGSLSPSSSLHHILWLINGESKSSPPVGS